MAGHSNSPESFVEVQALLDRALSANGLTLTFPNKGGASEYRYRIYAFRRALRAQSRKLYAPDEPGFNRCPYDDFVIQVFEPKSWPTSTLLIKPKSLSPEVIIQEGLHYD